MAVLIWFISTDNINFKGINPKGNIRLYGCNTANEFNGGTNISMTIRDASGMRTQGMTGFTMFMPITGKPFVKPYANSSASNWSLPFGGGIYEYK